MDRVMAYIEVHSLEFFGIMCVITLVMTVA